MKIGIITKIGKNYGAVLQAYALKSALERLGAETHIIRYMPEVSRRSYYTCRFSWGPRGIIQNAKAFVHRKEIQKGSDRFLSFREKHLDFIGNYYNNEELEQNPPDCDLYISGSDQVWNPVISFDPAFYLNFISNKNVRKVAYAASIGLNDIPIEYCNEFVERVHKFDFISVREKNAQEILIRFSISSTLAPDPTLLLEPNFWTNHAVLPAVVQPYLLCYFVSFPTGALELVNCIQKRLGYKVVNLMTSEESAAVGDIKVRDAGPEEFLGYFQNAAFILTSSFHGTVFSILNQKPFAVVLYQQTSSRVEELLQTIGLSNRIIDTTEKKLDSFISTPDDIYKPSVLKKIQEQREIGQKVLKEIVRVLP